MKDRLHEIITSLKKKKIQYADCRFVRTDHESIHVTNRVVDGLSRDRDIGVGFRVLHDGAWGFASTADLKPAGLRKCADLALQIARASAITKKETVRLADEPPHVGSYATKIEKNPFAISFDDKLGLLLGVTEIVLRSDKIKTAQASMDFYQTHKLFISTEGAEIEQELFESGAGYEVFAFDGKELQKRSYPNSHRGDFATRGYEFIEEMKLVDHAERVREEAIALLTAPSCPETSTTLIINGSQMALQVHESCGHPTELDRVLGTEISLAGGSFMTTDKLRKLRYGSDHVSIFADATIPGALGSFGYDDEGVKAQRSPLVKDGLFVGYLTSRETAPVIGRKRSNGTMRADGWNRMPLIRMTNINLEPGDWDYDDLIADTKNGLLFDTNKSWSIDDKRLNFQFGVEMAREIKNGKLGRIFKNPVYTGITPEFWNSCDAVCNKKHWRVWGVPNCGKGEPMQTARVAHGTAPSRFQNVKVGVSK